MAMFIYWSEAHELWRVDIGAVSRAHERLQGDERADVDRK